MPFAERANANSVAGSEVDVASDRGGVDVVPVRVFRGQFFGAASFDEFDPGWDFEFSYTEEVSWRGW
jgi:hypothetical protein